MTDAGYRHFYESDAYRRIYDGDLFLESYEAIYVDGRADELFARLTALRPRANIGSVLEFGTGGGWNLLPFIDAGIEAVGYDYSPELVALGTSKGLPLIQGSLEEIEGTYDVVLVVEVLEHLTDVLGSLKTLRRHMAPDGLLWIEVPDVEDFSIALLQNAHTYYFSRKTLEFFASQAGLRMVRHIREPEGCMSAGFVASDEEPLTIDFLAGHYDEMVAVLRRYGRSYRLRTPVRALGRVLDSVGLREPVQEALTTFSRK
jgi:SAM-dependent methyltransferase